MKSIRDFALASMNYAFQIAEWPLYRLDQNTILKGLVNGRFTGLVRRDL